MKNSEENFIVVRDDGFSQFFGEDVPDPLTPEEFLALNVDYLKDYPDVKVKELGVGPGSVFTFNTKVGDIILDDPTQEQLKVARPGDLRVGRCVKQLIESGKDPMQLVVDRCHELGLKMWARFELNHEYGPPSKYSFWWMILTGQFNHRHPEYRIKVYSGPGQHSVNLDFKHKEVRDFKLAIISEVLDHGVDGMSLDFCVYPPHLSDPEKDAHFITEFVRDVRKLADEAGTKQNKYVELIVRVPYASEKHGLSWQEWVSEGLLDYIIPSAVYINECWDVPNEEFVERCSGTKCKVLTCIRPFWGRVGTDEGKEDRKSGLVRTEEEMLPKNFYAKALNGLQNGSDGIQIAIGTGGLTDTRKIDYTKEFRRDGWRPLYGTLADKDFLEKQDKEYVFNNHDILPFDLSLDEPKKDLTLRIADEPEKIKRARLVFLARGLYLDEKVILTANDNIMVITEKELHLSTSEQPIFPQKGGRIDMNPYLLFRIPKWWEIGRNTIEIPVEMLIQGENKFTFEYTADEEHRKFNRSIKIGEIKLILDIN